MRLTGLILGVLTVTGTTVRAQDCMERFRQPASPATLPGPIIDAAWLSANRSAPDLVIIHVDQNRSAYEAAHIPGARFLPFGEIAPARAGVAAELPTVDEAIATLQRVGVTDRARVVIYGPVLAAARLWYTLDWLGHGQHAAVLDGGVDAWIAAGGPVTRELPTVVPGVLTPNIQADVLVTANWLKARLGAPDLRLLDGRSAEEFAGQRVDEGIPRPGHIPGARSLDWTTTMHEGRFKPLGEIRRMFEAAGAQEGEEIVTYCRTGTRSSVLHLLARALGYRARMYDGSMVEWSPRTDLPVER